MEQLAAREAGFLALQTATSPMHLGSVTLHDPRTLPGGMQGFKAILDGIERRLHLSPAFRRRLVTVPLGLDRPYWIEDPEFDLEFHVRHVALPQPGDWRQLCIQVARLHARPLDLARPLWELTVIEGLDRIEGLPPGAYAIVAKVHHAVASGLGDTDPLEALQDLVPRGAPVAPPVRPWQGETPPGALGLLARSWWHGVRSPLHVADLALRSVPALAQVAEDLLEPRVRRPARVPRTRFNAPVSPHRVVDARLFSLAELGRIAGAVAGADVHDAVLALCGGALRRYLLAHGELPEASLVALAPVAAPGSRGTPAVAPRIAALGTHLPDPLQRLHYVRGARRDGRGRPVGARLVAGYGRTMGPFVPTAVAGAAARLYTRLSLSNRHGPLFNCVITDVSGPPVPRYAAGARVVAEFGLSALFDGLGLAFNGARYCGQLALSFTACRELLPDPELLARCLEEAFRELLEAATGERAAVAPVPGLVDAVADVVRRSESLGHDLLIGAASRQAANASSMGCADARGGATRAVDAGPASARPPAVVRDEASPARASPTEASPTEASPTRASPTKASPTEAPRAEAPSTAQSPTETPATAASPAAGAVPPPARHWPRPMPRRPLRADAHPQPDAPPALRRRMPRVPARAVRLRLGLQQLELDSSGLRPADRTRGQDA